jgi:hypothetical protein
MGLLGGLFGDQDDDRRQQAMDFANRYEQGAPYDGISGQEAYENYNQVAGRIPPDVYQQSAQDAFSRMQPQERVQFGQMLQQQARQHGVMDNAWDEDDNQYQDPGYLAQVTGRLHQQQPGMLGQLLGGGGGGGLGGMMGGGGGGGLGSMLGGSNTGMGGVMGGGGQGQSMLDNPLAKAAIGGIAAMAMRRMMSGGR